MFQARRLYKQSHKDKTHVYSLQVDKCRRGSIAWALRPDHLGLNPGSAVC